MDGLQRNAGNMGIIGAVLLAVAFILFYSSGLADPQIVADPAQALPRITELGARWALTSVLFAASLAFIAVFLAGLYRRLRDKAPTRAAATLYFGLFGLLAFALLSMVQWVGGNELASYAARDRVAASHAWVGLNAFALGATAAGNAFIGASLVMAGWAAVSTGALPSALGWLGVVAGVVTVIGVFAPTAEFILLASSILVIVWLLWAGSQLRRTT